MPTQTEKTIRSILDSNLFGASIAKNDGLLVYANPALLELFNTTKEKFVGRKASEFYLNSGDREQIVEKLKKNGFISKIDVDLKRDDNSTFKATLSFMTSKYAGEDAYFCWFYDLTQRLEIEEELANQIKLNLHHSKLASIGELAAGIAHEINNPLTIVTISNRKLQKLLETDKLDKESLKQSLEIIKNATSRIVDIVRGMRNYSRIDSDNKETLDLVEIVEETNSLVFELLKAKGVKVSFNNEVGAAPINGIRGQLQQVIMNLISNAKDAVESIKKKEISIDILENEINYLVQVTDSGLGVADENKFKIFEPFFTTKGFDKGTGIGLSMSYNIIKEHDGALTCEDGPYGGARFTLSLPKVAI